MEYARASGVLDSKTYERVKRPLKSAEKPWDAKHPRTTIQRDSKTSEMIWPCSEHDAIMNSS